MEQIPAGEVERTMKMQEVILMAMAKKITWWEAAEILAISSRTMRRWKGTKRSLCIHPNRIRHAMSSSDDSSVRSVLLVEGYVAAVRACQSKVVQIECWSRSPGCETVRISITLPRGTQRLGNLKLDQSCSSNPNQNIKSDAQGKLLTVPNFAQTPATVLAPRVSFGNSTGVLDSRKFRAE